MLLLKPLFWTSSSWFWVLYSKSDIKITQPVSRIYQDHLFSSFDHKIISLFYFSTYVSSYVKYYPGLSILYSYHLWTAPWMLFPYKPLRRIILTRLSGHIWLSYKITLDTFPFPFWRKMHFSFSTNFLFPSLPVFVIWNPLSHCFLHFHHIIYINFPMYALILGYESGDISSISHFVRHIRMFFNWF